MDPTQAGQNQQRQQAAMVQALMGQNMANQQPGAPVGDPTQMDPSQMITPPPPSMLTTPPPGVGGGMPPGMPGMNPADLDKMQELQRLKSMFSGMGQVPVSNLSR